MIHGQDFNKIVFDSIDNAIIAKENFANVRFIKFRNDFSGIGKVSQPLDG